MVINHFIPNGNYSWAILANTVQTIQNREEATGDYIFMKDP
jgi:hypothetical protein